MKEFIFGCVLMVCGVIGGTGWVIAGVSLVQPGAWSTVFNLFDEPGGYIAILFYIFAIVGVGLAIKSMKKDK